MKVDTEREPIRCLLYFWIKKHNRKSLCRGDFTHIQETSSNKPRQASCHIVSKAVKPWSIRKCHVFFYSLLLGLLNQFLRSSAILDHDWHKNFFWFVDWHHFSPQWTVGHVFGIRVVPPAPLVNTTTMCSSESISRYLASTSKWYFAVTI